MGAIDVRIERGAGAAGRDARGKGWDGEAVRRPSLSVIMCPGCGKRYDVRVNTIDGEIFCDRCRLSTRVVIRPERYEPKAGEEKGSLKEEQRDSGE